MIPIALGSRSPIRWTNAAGSEGKRAPSNGERANYQAYKRAVVMKSGVGCEREISAQAEAAEEGEE